MSRVPPFPTTRVARSTSQSNGNAPPSSFLPPTRPLQINRPTTPGNSTAYPSSQVQGGPSRPRRSDSRSRQGAEYLDSEISYRDSVSTTRSDILQPQSSRNGTPSNPITPADSTNRRQRPQSSTDDVETSPTSLAAVISAFQSAGARHRAMANGTDGAGHGRDRQRDLEMESIRQQRIREKVPGRRTNGKARAGDIDGMCLRFIS
jgi:exocyst complex component 4